MRKLITGLIAGVLVAVAATLAVTIVVPMADHVWTATHTTWVPPIPLTQHEIYRLGATRAASNVCTIPIDFTDEALALNKRFSETRPHQAQDDALAEVAEGFKYEDCDSLLFRFSDLIYQWDG